MSPAGFHRTFVLAGDNHFSPLVAEQRTRLEHRYRRGPDIHEAILDVVAPLAPRRVLEVGAGTGRLAARIAARVGARVVAADTNAALTADADARGVEAIVADVTALPFDHDTMDCVIADRGLRHEREISDGLRETCRVLRAGGTFIAVARSVRRAGHELDVLLGGRRRRWGDALNAENAAILLRRRFLRVDELALDYALRFPDGEAAAAYAATLPGRAHMVRRLSGIARPIELTYGVTLFVAADPRRA